MSAAAPRETAHAALALGLAALAGYVDAVGYLEAGRLYLSFMSGNTTQFGVAIASSAFDPAIRAAEIIFCFLLGAVSGTLLAEAAGRSRLPCLLGVEFALCAVALGLELADVHPGALLPLAVAMGMQNSAHEVVAKAEIGKTFVTGTLFSLGQALARALKGQASLRTAGAFAASWAAFACGAMLGATALTRAGLAPALTAVALVLATLAAITAALPHTFAVEDQAR